MIEQNIDVACFSETHSVGDSIPKLKGFVTYNRNRNNKSKGGIAMIFKKELEPFILKLESGLDENEYFVCKITCFEPEVVLVLHYGVIENRYSTTEILTMQTEIFSVIKNYIEEGFDVFWTGDMNVHLGKCDKLKGNNPSESFGGKNLLKFIEQENLHLCNWDDQHHTHIDRSGGKSNILDLMITNVKEKIINFKVDTGFQFTPFRVRKVKTGTTRKFTDHVSLITEVGIKYKTNVKNNKHTGWNYYKKGGDERYKSEMDWLASEIQGQVMNKNIDIEEIHSNIIKGIDNVKKIAYGKTSQTKSQAQRLSDHAIWEKRMKEVEASYHTLKKIKITDRIWEMRNKVSYKFQDKQVVAVTNPETGKLTKSREETNNVVLEYNYNLLRKDNIKKTEEVKSKERLKATVTESAMMCDTPRDDMKFTWREMCEVIAKIREDNKTVYRDLIKSSPFVHRVMLEFFNRCYEEERVPREWDETTLMKLFKNKGKRTDLKMNRFIHLKPFMPKTFEKLLMKKIEQRLALKTPSFQIGGRKKSSTTEHLLTMMMFMKRLEKEQGGGICQFMDIKTCFDKMSLSDSLYQCAEAGIVGKPLRLVKEITDNLKIKIQGDSDPNRVKELRDCLGQGTGYAPTGTGVTMASTLEENMAEVEAETVMELEDFSLTPQVGPLTLDPLVFVDDMSKPCVTSTESAQMGTAITKTLDELKMEAHQDKSGLLIFGRNREKLKAEVEMNPTMIQNFKMGYKESETYLGMQFSNKGSSDSISLTLETRRMKCYIKAADLKTKLEDDRVSSVGWLITAITVFNASIVSTLTYGCGSWLSMLKKHTDHLEQTQRQCLYTVLDISNRSSYRNLLSVCGIMPATDMVKKLKITFVNELVHMKGEGLCFDNLTAEFN